MSQRENVNNNPVAFVAYPWHENPAPVVHRIKELLVNARFTVQSEMLHPGVIEIPVKEIENLLQADGVGIILAPDNDRLITAGVSREIHAAKSYKLPIFVMVDRAYTGIPGFRTELEGYVSGSDSVKQWFEYDRRALLEGGDVSAFKDWLAKVRGHLLRLHPTQKTRRLDFLAAFRRFHTNEISIVEAVEPLAAAARSGIEYFLAKLAEKAAQITGATIGVGGVPRRYPGRTQVELQGFWSRYSGGVSHFLGSWTRQGG